MSTVPTQIRIDSEIKVKANQLFSSLGLDMSGAVNMFLHQCVLRGGLPFPVEVPKFSERTVNAMEEAKLVSNDSSIQSYDNISDLRNALEV